MATKLHSIASLGDSVQQLKDFFFPENDAPGGCWTDAVQLSLSTAGDLLSALHRNKLVILKLYEQGGQFNIVHKGLLSEGDEATCLISLSVALQQKTVGTNTVILTSTWNCVIVGFASGYLRIYTDSGTQLFEQIFHPHPVRSLKYCHPKVLQDELIVMYHDIVIAVDGFSLYQCLRFCRLQQQRTATAGNTAKSHNISFKKWHLQDQGATCDVEFYGVKNTTPFEHLFQASLAGGSAQYIGHAGLGPVFSYVSVGRDPCVSLYTPSEQAAQPIMSEVVMSVASKLISYIPGSSWLTGWTGGGREEKVNFEPPASITKNICIEDPRREVVAIRASPRGELAILSDTFGRLLLLDVSSMILVNIWKGYRDAQCGWILLPGEGNRLTLFLVIYAKRRGILEVWCPYQHYRVAAFSVGKKCVLLSSMYGALGEGSLSKPLTVPSWRPAKSCCFLLRESGEILNLAVPFESCYGEKHLLKVEDEKVLAELRCTSSGPRRPGTGNTAKSHNISFKKWHLQDQGATCDVEFYGVKNTTPFEHLFQASLAGGSAQYIGHAGLGPVFSYVSVGRDPCVSLYTPSEQAAQPIMSEVVMSVASKLISYIPGSSWLTGWTGGGREEKVNFEPPASITKNICIEDPRREVVAIRASPRGELAILSDTFGRLLLLDVSSMILVNIWKGYRDAQCGWILLPGEGNRLTLFLVIYAKRRGILEVWCPYQHYRVAAFSVGKKCVLLSSMYGALGEGSLSKPLTVPSWRPAKSCCFLLRESGEILNLAVPFESCYGEKHLLKVEDEKVLEELRDQITTPGDPDFMRFEELYKQLQLASNITSVLDLVLRSRHALVFKIRVCNSLMGEIKSSKDLFTQPEFVELYHECRQFVRVSELYRKLCDLWKGCTFLSSTTRSPLLAEVQPVLERYFCKNQIDVSFDIPDPNTFHASFSTGRGACLNVEEERPVVFDPPSSARSLLVKFLSLIFLFTDSPPALLVGELQSLGLTIADIFSAFVEACLQLDIQLSSLEYQQQICDIVTKISTQHLSGPSSHHILPVCGSGRPRV
eukprot:sb/3461500/